MSFRTDCINTHWLDNEPVLNTIEFKAYFIFLFACRMVSNTTASNRQATNTNYVEPNPVV